MAPYHFYRGTPPSKPLGNLLRLERDVITGKKDLEAAFGTITTLELDLLTIAAAIFAVDRGEKRGEREDFARVLELQIPVVNIGRLQPLMSIVEQTLRLLSNDTWDVAL